MQAKTSTNSDHVKDSFLQEPKFVIAIGSSAGGLEAITDFLSTKPSNENAYVFIQHMSPDFNTILPDIIKNSCNVEIELIKHGDLLRAGGLYLLPPNKLMKIQSGQVELEDRHESHPHNYYPINYFFESLAADLKSKAIGIILSGTGQDGTRGIEFIRKHQGYVIIQSPEDAKFDGMPRNAILTDKANIVLDAKNIHYHLQEYTESFTRSDLNAFKKLAYSPENSKLSSALAKIFLKIKHEKAVDFSCYKQSRILQKIQTRLEITKSKNIQAYADIILKSQEELELLYLELLSTSSHFFDSRSCLIQFKDETLPLLIKRAQAADMKHLRFWVIGCATGEETYSFAMIIDNFIKEKGLDLTFKIFATDINHTALKTAVKGSYSDKVLSSIPLEFHGKYFSHDNEQILFRDRFKDKIIFAGHNLIESTFFGSIDFISCRGLLNTLKEEVVLNTLQNIAFSLQRHDGDNGFLLIDPDEHLKDTDSLLKPSKKDSQFYQSTAVLKRPNIPNVIQKRIEDDEESVSFKIYNKLDKALIPPTIVFNEDSRVQYFFGDLRGIANFKNQEASQELKHFIPQSIFELVSSLKKQLLIGKRPVSDFHKITTLDNFTQFLNISLSIVEQESPTLFSIKIEKIGKKLKHTEVPEDMSKLEQKCYFLELELEKSYKLLNEKDNERSLLVNQLQASNEESKSINQALLVSTEELESNNELLAAEIEKRKGTEQSLRNAIVEAEKAVRVKGEFLANMSHEIRTPLNGIIGIASIMEKLKLSAKLEDYVNIMKQSGETLLYIVNDILDVSKLESGKVTLEKEKFNLRSLISVIAESHYPSIQNKKLSFFIDYPCDLPRDIVSDPARLRQVIDNLLSNSIKFTQEGSIIIEVTFHDKLNELTISVIDTGIGISKDKTEIIFDRFTQADSSTTKNYGGTGLGLSISSQIIQLMGGKIFCQSKVSKGSKFSAKIPISNKLDTLAYPLPDFNKIGLIFEITEPKMKSALINSFNSLEATILSSFESILKQSGDFDYIFILADNYFNKNREDFERIKDKTTILNLGAKRDEENIINIEKPYLIESFLKKIVPNSKLLETSCYENTNNPKDSQAITTKKLKILLAEDNEINQIVAIDLLNSFAAKIDIAANGKEAVSLFQENSYDLIFMDCLMPIMDGFEALEIIKNLESKDTRPPIIAVTANAMKGDKENCLKAGFDNYLSKPITPLELNKVVKESLSNKE